jgi:hypothetical protein
VSIGTCFVERTVALKERFAYWCVGRNAVAEVLEEEGCEGEFVGLWWLDGEDLGGDGFGV